MCHGLTHGHHVYLKIAVQYLQVILYFENQFLNVNSLKKYNEMLKFYFNSNEAYQIQCQVCKAQWRILTKLSGHAIRCMIKYFNGAEMGVEMQPI